jgi:hypothetical protein
MTDTPLTTIVERINHALENVIAPEIESTIVRGQLFAVVELLNQLQGKYEYRHDLMVQDIQVGRQMLATLIEAFEKAGVETPETISTATREVDLLGMSGDQLREVRGGVETAVSAALDLLDASRSAIAEAESVEKAVLGLIGGNILRDMMLFRRQRFDKISQRAQEE